MTTISTGLHFVRKRLKNGDRWYVYAWRGGPVIHKQDGDKPAITRDLLDRAYAERHGGRSTKGTVDELIDQYRDSPDFAGKAANTQREYKLRLNQISERFGRVPLHLAHQLRPQIMEWRDELAETPRAADRCVGMISTLMSWGLDRNLVASNPAYEIGKLHKVNRAGLIWEDRHWQAVEGLPGYIHRVLRLASLTGLRISDLLVLRWEDVQDGYIALKTQKTGGEAIIPLHPELERFLTGPGQGAILRNSLGKQWTSDGWQSSWQRFRPDGFDRKVHDLRGTFATLLMIAGFTDIEIAMILGWRAERIATIRARYVDRTRVAKAMAERFKR